MVYRTVTDTLFFHVANDLFKCVEVLCRVAVKLHIGNMSAVCKSMIRSFQLDFFESAYREINRNMETVCIIVSVGNSFDYTVFFLVYFYKSS